MSQKFCSHSTMWRFLIILVLLIKLCSAANPDSIQTRILNGQNALPGQFPWMVSIRSVASSSHMCGGALVTPEHVVTAAHCIVAPPNLIFVISGLVNNLEGGRNTAVSEIRIHPEYNLTHFEPRYDVGVMKLASKIPFNAFELPIPLATKDPGVYPCVLSGWGMTLFPSSSSPAQLQTIILRSMSRETCLESWDAETVSESVLCVGGVLTEGGCFGDSGSPLVCHGELAGVVSTGDSCANGRPDLYAKIFYFRDWLLDTIAETSIAGSIYAAQARMMTADS